MSKYLAPLFSTLLTWVVLSFVSHGVKDGFGADETLSDYLLAGLAILLALALSRLSLKYTNTPRWIKILFWIPTAPMAVCILFELFETINIAPWLLGAAAIVGPGIWIACRTPDPKSRVLTELANIGLAMLCIAFVLLPVFGFTKIQAQYLQRKADASWAEIGRPMSEYKNHLSRTEENQAFKELLSSLAPLGITSLYKNDQIWNEGAGMIKRRPASPLASETFYFAGPPPCADEVPGPQRPLLYRDAHLADLNRIYEGLLKNPEPVWKIDQTQDWPTLRVPNYLTMRRLAQLTVADCNLRLHEKDIAGAAKASAAMLLANRNHRRQPVSVSLMVNAGLEAFFAPITARLPEDPKAWDALSEKAGEFRAQLGKTLQAEAYGIGAIKDAEVFKASQILSGLKTNLAFARLTHAFPIQAARVSCIYAEQVKILGNCKDYSKGDLGDSALKAAALKYDINYVNDTSRCAQRINCALVLLEQAEMIRFARARVQEGTAHAEHGSVVMPGLKWIMEGDLTNKSATIKLNVVPPWLINNEVAPPEFFLLPLDGSKSWAFRS